jgi:UV DNA damage endonuclease
MLARLGFVASVLTEDFSTSRTCRLRNATDARIRELIVANLSALDRVVSFLETHRIHLYRITSNLIPFASHHVNTIQWWHEYADTFTRLGARMAKTGIRVSTHPGQFTVLNSPHARIVQAAISELAYHARLLDALGTNATCKIVVHVGGLYAGSERIAMDRFISTAKSLPQPVLRRLVVENDDRLFDAEEVLQVGRAVGIPVVFDWLHHQANPCRRPISEVLAEIFSTWSSHHGRPKVHLSSQAAGGPAGAHAEYVEVADLIAFTRVAPDRPFDCMLEAKQKDRALLRLRDELKAHGVIEQAFAGELTHLR